jgi:PTH1 family peptidyl-tRNA hydrolase
MRFYKLVPEQVLVLHDELDLLPGQVKLKQGGGHAGHNGLRDIQSAFSSADFWRLRLGIGHPRSFGLAQQVAAFVLNAPRKEDMAGLEDSINRSRVVLPLLLDGEYQQAMSRLHESNRA